MSRGERETMITRDRPGLSLSRQCRLLSISRSSFYDTPKSESPENLALMRRIDALFLKYPFHGSRQMARHVRREDVYVGRHRVRRLMRLMGLAAIYQAPRTSDPHPAHRIYPYLLKGMVIDRPNQVPSRVHGQHLHRTALAVAQRRGGLSTRPDGRLHRSQGHRCVDGLLQYRAPAFRPRRPTVGQTPAEAYRDGRPVDMMDKASALTLNACVQAPRAQQRQREDRTKGILAA